MSVEAGECADVYDERFPRARKPHRCEACGETIAPGHRYARVGVVWEGTADSWIRCMRCQKIHEHLREVCRGETGGDEWPDDRLNCGHEYTERWGKEPPPEIAALAFALPGEVKP